MPFFNFPSSFHVIITTIIFFIFPVTISGAQTCDTSSNFTTNDPYDKNLSELLSYLVYATPLTGSSLVSKGRGENKVYGMSMCTGTYSTLDCKNCIVNAGNNLRSVCPNNKGAFQWEGFCLVKYLNVDFFGQLLQSTSSVGDPVNNTYASYTQKVVEYLRNVSREASTNANMALIQNTVVIENDKKVLGVVQCTNDIASIDCRSCADDSLKVLNECCNSSKRAVVFGGSCLIGYAMLF